MDTSAILFMLCFVVAVLAFFAVVAYLLKIKLSSPCSGTMLNCAERQHLIEAGSEIKNSEQFDSRAELYLHNCKRVKYQSNSKELNHSCFSFLVDRGINTNCAICLEDYCEDEDIIILDCSHSFHEVCIAKWLQNKVESSCPLCKSALYVENEETELKYNVNPFYGSTLF